MLKSGKGLSSTALPKYNSEGCYYISRSDSMVIVNKSSSEASILTYLVSRDYENNAVLTKHLSHTWILLKLILQITLNDGKH